MLNIKTLNQAKIVAVPLVKATGDLLIKKFQHFDRRTIRLKSKHEIVTAFDLLSEKLIIGKLHSAFPDMSILSEESGRDKIKSDWLWILDPLDGTTNFTMHNPLWTISLALCYHSQVVLAIVYAPMLSEMFIAIQGQGAKLNNRPIQVSQVKTNWALHAFCHGSSQHHINRAIKYYSQQKAKHLDCRQLGSAALELAYVASGRLESITIPGANAWDVAAGVLLVNEAGGRVTDFKNKNWHIKSTDMLASNRVIHEEILKVINKI